MSADNKGLAADWSHIELTCLYAFYFNQQSGDSLIALLRTYAGCAPALLDRIRFVLVDDGSPIRVQIPDSIDPQT